MRGKIATLAFACGMGIAAGVHAESCYSNDDVAAARTYWQNASEREINWIIWHDQQFWNIAGAACNLVQGGREVREDEFDIAWRNMKVPPDIAGNLEDAGKPRPNFYRFLAALYFKVVVPSPEAKAAHD